MTRSHGKHSTRMKAVPPALPSPDASSVESEVRRNDVVDPMFRWAMWVWALAFLALFVQALLDLIYGAIFGPAGR